MNLTFFSSHKNEMLFFLHRPNASPNKSKPVECQSIFTRRITTCYIFEIVLLLLAVGRLLLDMLRLPERVTSVDENVARIYRRCSAESR